MSTTTMDLRTSPDMTTRRGADRRATDWRAGDVPVVRRQAVDRAAAAPAMTRQVHLTRRGRLVLLLALVGVLFAAFSLGRANSQASPARRTSMVAAAEQITVQPGESLWAVARRIAPDNDPREVIAQIRRLNDLDGTALQTGQQLLLPVAA